MTTNETISNRIKALIANGADPIDALKAVVGVARVDAMISELYDELRAMPTPEPPPAQAGSLTRDQAIYQIKTALEARSGKRWSVTGGRGTAWGWITIDALPAVRADETAHGFALRDLAELLGLESAHRQGVSIPASSAHYREFIERAKGLPVTQVAAAYWD